DIPLIAERLLSQFKEKTFPKAQTHLSRDVLERLQSHHWPGNVRELENVLQRALVAARGGEIGPQHLVITGGAAPSSGAKAADKKLTTAAAEREEKKQRFKKLLASGTPVTVAAALVKVVESTAHRWRQELEDRGDLPRSPRR